MGTLLAHYIPCCWLSFMGLWWTTHIFKRYLRIKHSGEGSFTNSCFYPFKNRTTVEEYVFLVIVAFWLPGEYYVTGFHLCPENYQHIFMHIGIGLAVGVALMERKKWLVPPGTNYVCLGWANTLVAILFYFHMHRNVPLLEQMMHGVVTTLFAAIAVLYFLELAHPKQVLVGLTRAYLTLLLGIWFGHGAYLLYPDSWTTVSIQATDEQVMMLPVFFALDCFVAFAAVVISGIVQYDLIRRGMPSTEYHKILTSEEKEESSAFI